MKAAIATLLTVAAATAAAQPIAAGVDRTALQAAIDRELRDVPRDGKLDVDVHQDGTATVTYIRADGARLERQVILPERPDDAVEMLALLSGNLVRDQARDVLADLTLVAPAPRPHPRKWATFGLFPPVSTDLAYGEPVIPYLALNLIVGVGPGVRGVAISAGVDVEEEQTSGAHIAGGSNVALAGMDGLQLSSSANLTMGAMNGAQVTGGVNIAGQARGAQVAGLANIAGSFAGVQIAPFNFAGHARGLQLGVVNYSSRNDGAPIGLISIVRHGLTELDVWGESLRTGNIVLRHGARWLHNLYGFAGNDSVQMFGFGFGSRIYQGPVDLDVGLITWAVNGPDIHADLSILNQARFTAALPLGHMALFAGAALDVYVADSGERGDALHPALDKVFVTSSTTTRMWPTFFAGLRVR